jgi:hypothetical protein
MTDSDLTEEEKRKLTTLREKEDHGSQLETEADQPDFVDAVTEELTRVENGDLSGSVSFYDPRGAALIAALQDDDRDDVARALAEAANSDYEPAWDRSTLLRWTFRAALQDHAPAVLEDAQTAQARLTDF